MRVKLRDAPSEPVGTVRWRGSLRGIQGEFLGVELDECLGKHDGTLDGKRYFTTSEGYAVFVRPIAAKALATTDRRSSDRRSSGA